MYRWRPGPGFFVVFLTAAISTAFFVWGARMPELERVWRIQLGLEAGKRRALSASERKIFSEAIQRHPDIAEGMLGARDIGIISAHRDGLIETGYAYLIRKKSSPKYVLELTATDARGTKPIEVEVRTNSAEKKGTVAAGSPFVWELPDEGPFPDLIEVRIDAPGKRDRHAIVVRTRELAP